MIISFDVGIKNLAYCVIDNSNNEYKITHWDVANLCGEKPTCCHKTKKGICGKTASYNFKQQDYYCGTHVKKVPNKQLAPDIYYKIVKAKKPSKKALKQLNGVNNTNYDKEELCSYVEEHYLLKNISLKTANQLDLIEIGCLIAKILPDILPMNKITTVLIENQISPIANRMKTIQGMLAQFFIDRGITNIEFVSSHNKLKAFDVKKKTYAERKKSGIEVTEKLINEKDSLKEWKTLFKSHKKKDDLADSFLQGLWYLSKK
uniref:Uncharacterized protein n=1 Tax=viral metagenome TaxID=1070528 RepID=A0A6C0CPR8_9ZZZZ